ncbi:GNAT family N-acetyltransferase [Haloferula chungangensis]|uniref:GNAT family N-acetyltransferase n=1 Tax=Haloferula chungangensis TaxID=1048331 RepID=A0ABW2L4D7_9BACT
MIRIYQHGDHHSIARIFSRAVHEIASEVYSPEQCLAWSQVEPQPEHWEKRCELKRPFVAVKQSQIAGFLELDPDGHIDYAYVNPDFKRQGIMTRLVTHAVDVAFSMNLPRVYVEASICAKPLFERAGFCVIADRGVDLSGIHLQNYEMELKNAHA